jgi:hypothetical protein
MAAYVTVNTSDTKAGNYTTPGDVTVGDVALS